MDVESKGTNAVVYWYDVNAAPWGSARIRATSLNDIKPAEGSSTIREGELHQVLFHGQFYPAIILEILDDTLLKDLVWELHRKDATRRERRGDRQAMALGLFNKGLKPIQQTVMNFPRPPLSDNNDSIQETNVEADIKQQNLSSACHLVRDVGRSDSSHGSIGSVGSVEESGRQTPKTRARLWGRFKERR